MAVLAWSFALGSLNNRDIGLQPLYERPELNQYGLHNLHDTPYPSVHWQYPASKPSPGVFLRPTPSPDMRQFNFASVSTTEEDQFGKLCTLPLANIRVYYNAFSPRDHLSIRKRNVSQPWQHRWPGRSLPLRRNRAYVRELVPRAGAASGENTWLGQRHQGKLNP